MTYTQSLKQILEHCLGIIRLGLFLLLLSFSLSSDAQPLSNEYDIYFLKHGAHYNPQYDWKWFKAQGYQESTLNRFAVSPAGAVGVMQFMGGTWNDCQAALNFKASRYHASANIRCGNWYMRRQAKLWSGRPRSEAELLVLAQVSYNAGAGNILKAQALCNDVLKWDDMAPCLEKVTGRHSVETLDYPIRIRAWYNRIKD